MASPVASTIVWLRDDLRLDDNPALAHAVDLGMPLTVVYILDENPRESVRCGASQMVAAPFPGGPLRRP